MSSQDKNLPYEILTLSHLGFKFCSVHQLTPGCRKQLVVFQISETDFTFFAAKFSRDFFKAHLLQDDYLTKKTQVHKNASFESIFISLCKKIGSELTPLLESV